MKNIKNLSLLLFTLMFTISCEETYEPPFDNYSSFEWYTSDGYDTSEKVLNLNRYIIFSDVSQNATNHAWSIPAECKFLEGDINSDMEDFTEFIMPGNTIISSEKTVNVLFPEPGIFEVKLTNTFEYEVEEATETANGWVVEKIFTIEVFNNLNPACTVFKYDYSVDPDNPTLEEVIILTEDEETSADDADSWPVVSIEAGEELVYVDKTITGKPTARSWTFTGGKPDTSNKEEAIIKYNKLGVFEAGTIESIRKGDEVPEYTSTKIIPLKIEVIPSTKPFVQSGKATLENGVISFAVTGEIEQIANQKDFFTVHVTNEDAMFDQNIAIESVEFNSTDATIIEITLAEPTYNTDEIEVSFAGGNIVSVDSRVLEDFGPVSVGFGL